MPNGFQPYMPEGAPLYVDPQQLARQQAEINQSINGGLSMLQAPLQQAQDEARLRQQLKDPQVQELLRTYLGGSPAEANPAPSVAGMANGVVDARSIMYPGGSRPVPQTQGAPSGGPPVTYPGDPKPEPVPAPRYGFNPGGGFYPETPKNQDFKPDPESGNPVLTEDIEVRGTPPAKKPPLSEEAARFIAQHLPQLTQLRVQDRAADSRQTLQNQKIDADMVKLQIREGRRLAEAAMKEQAALDKEQRKLAQKIGKGQMTPKEIQKYLTEAENRLQRNMATRAKMVDGMADDKDIDALDEMISKDRERILTYQEVYDKLTSRFKRQQGISTP